MESQHVTVAGWVSYNGVLQVETKSNLPPGPVSVTVEAVPAGEREDTREALVAIWAERQARGVRSRSKEEIDAEIDAMRNEDDQRLREIERLYSQLHGGKE